MDNGKIKWLNANNAFGYITPINSGEDIIFHRGAVMVSGGMKALKVGMMVAFETDKKDPEGPSAVNVVLH
jgi:cold shock CspA family protein